MNTITECLVAKEFKDFDRIYREFTNTILEKDIYAGDEEYVTRWQHVVHKHSPDDVRHAVYNSRTSDNWQKFRVSLKGQSTKLKLYRMGHRFARMLQNDDAHEQSLERVRIDNYIGALRRGGQLDKEGNIVR